MAQANRGVGSVRPRTLRGSRVPMSLVDFEPDELHLPRNAFSPRDCARAGDLWRLLQDAAVLGSAKQGWSPARYRAHGSAFVVRRMVTHHRREVAFGEPLQVRTWVSSFRGGRFSNRQLRVRVKDDTVCEATQEWIHVSTPAMRISRASPELLSSFQIHDLEPDVTLPEVTAPSEGAPHRFSFEVWHGWMDPLSHANHPLYLDWCDEALARILAAAGADPQSLVPIAESVSWKVGITATQRVTVQTRYLGRTDAECVVCEHQILVAETVCATATTVRTTSTGSEVLVAALDE